MADAPLLGSLYMVRESSEKYTREEAIEDLENDVAVGQVRDLLRAAGDAEGARIVWSFRDPVHERPEDGMPERFRGPCFQELLRR